MKSNFLKTAFTLVAFSGLISPTVTYSTDILKEEVFTQIVIPTTKCTKIMNSNFGMGRREVTDWDTLNSCRTVSTGWKKSIDKFILDNKLLTFYLTPDNYKDERLQGLSPLITVLSFKNWKGDSLKEIGNALVANPFPFLKTLNYWGHDEDAYSSSTNCHSLGVLGSKSLADMLNQFSESNPCPWTQLQELKIVSKCDPILWESLDKLPNLPKLYLSGTGDLRKFAKKAPSLDNLTSLTWDGWLDRLNVRTLSKEIAKGKFKKLEYLKIGSSMQCDELQYAQKKFEKLHDKRPNLKVDTSR